MAKTIQELRKEKGFRSAREFAEALGISPSSMSRYDKDPETIPVKAAWAMADALGCSIDEIVGRARVTSGASELQDFYDGLLPETRALFDEFVEFAGVKDKAARDRAEAEENAKYEHLCQFHERAFQRSLYEKAGLGELVEFSSPAAERTAFEQFLLAKAAEKRKPGIDLHIEGLEEEMRGGYLDADGAERHWTDGEIQSVLADERAQMDEEFGKRDEEVIAKVMEAYDRLHGRSLRNWAVHSGEATPEQLVRYATVRLPE